VYGQSSSSVGVHGVSSTGAGVVGESGPWVGVYGQSDTYTGVEGSSTTGAGVAGGSESWYGVYGESLHGDGVHGVSHEPNLAGVAGINDAVGGIGVFGTAPSTGYAARFDGRALIQSPGGTLPLVVKQDAAESATPGLAVFETSNGLLGSLGANTGTFVVGAASGKALGFNVNTTTRAMTIDSAGNVGIGPTTSNAKLEVRDQNAGANDLVFYVNRSDNVASLFSVYNNGTVSFGTWAPGFGTNALCYFQFAADQNFFQRCSSAAEYVPAIDGGAGFPETADVVSIAPGIANPYGDDHGPFVVAKSTHPCDPNLLGFIVNPESGASGEKLNEHYLPLAIYGYFPAKVTTENGLIRRGDALTSSSTPGYAMKATQACKIIGYALEDADHDGTIQVFANLGESAAPEVATLRTQVEELSQAVADLRQENAALDQRLTALEQTIGGQAPTQSAAPREVVLLGALLVFGMVVARRPDKRGSH
jgi:hypothetical protein